MSNIQHGEFDKILNGISQQLMTEGSDKEGFIINYNMPQEIIRILQSKVIPDVKDDKINLKFIKNRFSEIISDSIRSAGSKGAITKHFDLKYMVILLELLELLPT